MALKFSTPFKIYIRKTTATTPPYVITPQHTKHNSTALFKLLIAAQLRSLNNEQLPDTSELIPRPPITPQPQPPRDLRTPVGRQLPLIGAPPPPPPPPSSSLGHPVDEKVGQDQGCGSLMKVRGESSTAPSPPHPVVGSRSGGRALSGAVSGARNRRARTC